MRAPLLAGVVLLSGCFSVEQRDFGNPCDPKNGGCVQLDAATDSALMGCALVPAAPAVGADCSGDPGLCGLGAQCVSGGTERSSRCVQLCVPDLCEDVCGAGETCNQLVGPDGLARTFPDGTTPKGGCRAPAAPPPGPYESCAGSGTCQATLRCATLGQSGSTVCFPICALDTDCPEIEGRASQCNIQVDGEATLLCGLSCTTATDCPGSLGCEDGLCFP